MSILGFISKKNVPPLLFEGNGDYDQEVVGESFYQKALNKICGGKSKDGHKKEVVAVLICDDKNKYDSEAVRVDVLGKPVGHLSKSEARVFRKRLIQIDKEGAVVQCGGLIVGGWKRGLFDKGSYGIKLDLEINKINQA